MYSQNHIRRNNKDIIYFACENSKTSLLIAMNAIENLIYSNDLSPNAKKQITALKRVTSRINDIQHNIE